MIDYISESPILSSLCSNCDHVFQKVSGCDGCLNGEWIYYYAVNVIDDEKAINNREHMTKYFYSLTGKYYRFENYNNILAAKHICKRCDRPAYLIY